MGKKKFVGFKKSNSKIDTLKNATGSDNEDDEAIEQHLQSMLEDEIDQYNSQKDQSLLDKANKKPKGRGRNRKKDDDDSEEEEEEVYELGLSSSDEDDDTRIKKIAQKNNFLQESSEDDDDDDDDEDIMGPSDPNYGVPDSRAWGKKSKIFHNTDYVDQDFGGFDGSDAEMADQEEAEAKEIQKRLTAELDESDFLGLIPIAKLDTVKKSSQTSKEILKVEFDNLSLADKRKLVERECPEVIHMLDEYKDKLKEAKATKAILQTETVEFLTGFYQSKYHSLLNYCINISYYLYLRATHPTNCKGHPVIKRILQFRRLLDELSQFDPKKYESTHLQSSSKLKRKKLTKTKVHSSKKKDQRDDMEMGQALEMKNGETEDMDEGGDSLEKRGITYAIAKNKGMTPRRKKEQRNPRVKHREKFRKAIIRRKGQVRTSRTEVHRYEGEMSGIKSNVTKSIKLK